MTPLRRRQANPNLGAYFGIVASAFVSLVVGLAMFEQLGWEQTSLAQAMILMPLVLYLERVQDAIAPTTFWVGIIKAPFFGLLIALSGTYRGLQVRDSSRELGRLTTVAVVQSIFLVIFANAIFDTLEDLEAALTEALRPYWQNPAKLQRLVGYPWWCHAVAGVNSNSSPSERK
jgi:hypothetical protein